MKQKLLCLATLMGMASVAFAQSNIEFDLTNPGWGKKLFAVGEHEVTFTDKWQGIIIHNCQDGFISTTEYKGVEISLKEHCEHLQCIVVRHTVDSEGNSTTDTKALNYLPFADADYQPTKSRTIMFDDYKSDDTYNGNIQVCIASKDGTPNPTAVTIENIQLIDKDGNKTPARYYVQYPNATSNYLSGSDEYSVEFYADYQLLGFTNVDLNEYRQIKVEFAEEVTDDLLIWGNYTTTEGGEGYCLGEYGGGILKGKSGIQTYDLPAADMAKDGICKVAGIMKDPKAEGAQSICLKSMTLVSSKSTPIEDLNAKPEVISTEYYSISGSVSSEPHKGINIVKERLSNGDIRIGRIVKR